MVSRKVVARLALATVALALSPPLAARAQDEPAEPGDTRQTALGPVPEGQRQLGAIDVIGDVDVYSFELKSAPSALYVDVAHTGGGCELWAKLLGSDGAELTADSFVPKNELVRLSTIALTGGTYYVSLSAGESAACQGATYFLTFSTADLPLDEPPPTSQPLLLRDLTTTRAIFLCTAWCNRAARLTSRAEHLRDRISNAHGRRRAKLKAILARVEDRLDHAKKKRRHWCRLAGV